MSLVSIDARDKTPIYAQLEEAAVARVGAALREAIREIA